MGVKVRQRNGAWWVFVDHKRQRKAKRVGVGEAGKRAAADVAKAYEVQLALGTFDFSKDTGLTFETYARQWLDTYGRTLKLGTREKYAEVLRVHWFPTIGPVKVPDITRAQVKAVLNEKAKTYARSTVTIMADVLRACLNAAVEDRVIDQNPAARLGKGVAKGRRAEPVEAFSAGVLAFILETAKLKDPDLYPVVLLLARTGLRIGEALALQVDDINLANRCLHVRRTWGSRVSAHGQDRFNSPKGHKTRQVDLSRQLTETLRRSLPAEGWAFPGVVAGTPMHPGTFLRRWRTLLAEARLTYKKPHTLRHTCASLLIQNGESLAYVRDQLGHASIKITVDTYGHFVPGANKAAVDRLDELMGRNLYATGRKNVRTTQPRGGS